MPASLAAQKDHGDVVTLAPLHAFLARYRLILLPGLGAIFLLGVVLVGVVWWQSPVTRVTSLQLFLGFPGSQDGQYPNGLPFSPEELLDPAVLRTIYDRQQLGPGIDFPAFQAALSVSQSTEDLQKILRDYQPRLADSKLSGPDRQALEEEYRSRLRSAASTLFTLSWYEDAGTASPVPAEVKAKVLADLAAVWAGLAVQNKQVLLFSSRLPGLNPRPPSEERGELETFLNLDALARAFEDGLASLEKLPGAAQASLTDGTTLIDLRLRLRAFREQTLPALQESLLTRLGSDREARRLEESLQLQLDFRENRAGFSRARLAALVETFRDFLAGRPGAGGLDAEGAPAGAAAGLDETFLSRLLGLAQAGADRDYLKKMLAEIEAARLQVARDELSAAELRQNLETIRSLLAPRAAERPGGTPLQPPPPQEDRAGPAPIVALQETSLQLGRMLDASRQLLLAISTGYLGRQPELFTLTRGVEVDEVRPLSQARLGLAFLAWVVLGSAALGLLLYLQHRGRALVRTARPR
jgi:hypothetical protein